MTAISKRTQFAGLVAWLVITFLAAGIGSLAIMQAETFYARLVLPSWAPPSAVFGPVWTVLYAFMGIAAWLVWREGGFGAARTALTLFLLQLAVNALWSWFFFGWHLGALSFAFILLLWVLIAATLITFLRIRSLAGILLVPYLLWVSFASVLNYTIWQLNPRLLG